MHTRPRYMIYLAIVHAHTRTDERIIFDSLVKQKKRRKKEDRAHRFDTISRNYIRARETYSTILLHGDTWYDREIFIRRKMKTHQRHPHNLLVRCWRKFEKERENG